jgi:hypothetical protein
MGRGRRLSSLSAFPRPEHSSSTVLGGAITLFSALLALVLLLNETRDFLLLSRTTELGVDGQRGQRDLTTTLDVTFPHVPCICLTLDAGDVAGTQEDIALKQRIELSRTRLDARGAVIGTFQPHESGKLPNDTPQIILLGMLMQLFSNVDTEEIQKSVAAKEGCRLAAKFALPRVAGEFHVSTHTLAEQLMGGAHLNASYFVHTLAFGPPLPGFFNPLDGAQRSAGDSELGGSFRHFIKLVPTTYKRRGGGEVHSHQYSAAEYFSRSRSVFESMVAPAFSIAYDFSPVLVTIKERPRGSILQLLVRACAVVGGVYSLGDGAGRIAHRVTGAAPR